MRMMSFEEAKELYLAKGNSLLVKCVLAHGWSAKGEEMLMEAIAKENLVQCETDKANPARLQPSEKLEKKNPDFEEYLNNLRKSLPPHYDKAKFLHAERVAIVDAHLDYIKGGIAMPDLALLHLNGNTREIHELFEYNIEPTWKEIDELTALGRFPQEAMKEDLPTNPLELVKLRNALRSYVSRAVNGKKWKGKNREELMAELATVELKLKQYA